MSQSHHSSLNRPLKAQVKLGIERLLTEKKWEAELSGNICVLTHQGAVDSQCQLTLDLLMKQYAKRLKFILGPQHGFFSDVQDNMVETEDFVHPHYGVPVKSLYAESRSPSPAWFKDIQTVLIDLQDVGCRVYTYATTVLYTLRTLHQMPPSQRPKVILLDRPNPVGLERIEGPLLDLQYKSFVGELPIPMRHALTLGELAQFMIQEEKLRIDLKVIPVAGLSRSMDFWDTGLPWVLPSPNLPRAEGALCFPGSVLFEGTKISEGRGTTHALEVFGHPALRPYEFLKEFKANLTSLKLTKGYHLRPWWFQPTFQKHAKSTCGGIQVHIDYSKRKSFRPWALFQVALYTLKRHLGKKFQWQDPPYEYIPDKNPMDVINGGQDLRHWIEGGNLEDLFSIEKGDGDHGLESYKQKVEKVKIYS